MKRPHLQDTKELLPEAWQVWLSSVEAVLCEALLPLFLLHCRRGQPRVPVPSLAASLDAAGGKPLPGSAAPGVARLLVEVCPESFSMQEASPSGDEPASMAFRISPKALRLQEDAAGGRSPATCGGVVAKGYSLALPPEEGPGGAGMKDPQGRRWRKAQGRFYVDLSAVERELNDHKAKMLRCLAAFAELRREEVPPPLVRSEKAGAMGAPAGDVGAADEDTTAAEEAASGRSRPVPGLDTEAATAAGAPDGAASGGASVLGFVASLREHPNYRDQVCHVESYAARPAEYASFEDLVGPTGQPLLSGPVMKALQGELGIDRLFRHQHSALKAVLGEKRHLCLTTGTSSGKSLAFALPILEDFRKDPSTRALVLFPTKALAQDQLGKLQRLFHAVCPALGVCAFDGDTARGERPELLRNSHVFLTNPDMLHFTILASHTRWRNILENLKYVVLDEAHVYRATFGTHMALLLRRFRRVLQHYGASPLFVACSATIRSAEPFFKQLLNLGPEDSCMVVDEDTAGRGERHFCLWNPPLLELEDGQVASKQRKCGAASVSERNAQKRARFREREGNGAAPRLPPGVGFKTRSSSYNEAAWILAQALRQGHRTVCFLQVRSMVEIVLQLTTGHLEDRSDLQGRLAAYRAGYAAEDRRRLERRLFSGDLLGVVATNALELGIDIGDLDMTIHVGVPPTVASVWQQAGRAGRRGRASAAVLVAMDAPMEQHFCRHPEEFFRRTLEARMPDVSNEFLLHGHVLCAAAEMPPLRVAEAVRWFGDAVRPVLEEGRRLGRLVVQAPRPGDTAQGSEDDTLLRCCQAKGKKAPKEEVNLRDIDPIQYKVIIRGNTTPLETLDQKLAFMRLHPGAVYLNQQTAYFVEELDQNTRIAWVVPRHPRQLDYYTECQEHTQIVLSGGGAARAAALPAEVMQHIGTPVVRYGGVMVHWRMYGFRKKAKEDHRVLDSIALSLPAVEYPTQAVWMDLPGPVLQPVAQAEHSVDRGGLHALEHAMISLAPLCCDLEAAELSCQHTRRDSDPNRYLLLLYELQKGGAGTAVKVYAQWEMLLKRAVRLIEECPCDTGCPNCIVVPFCGEYNHGLDKAAAVKVGRALGLGLGPPPPAPAAAQLLAAPAGSSTAAASKAATAADASSAEQVPAQTAEAPAASLTAAAAAEGPGSATASLGDAEGAPLSRAAAPGRHAWGARVGVFTQRLNGVGTATSSDAGRTCLELD